MIDSMAQLRTGAGVIFVSGAALSLATMALGGDGPGRWLVEDLHEIDASLADQAQTALLWLVSLSFISGLARYYSGLLARVRRTEIISAGSLAAIGVRITSVFLLIDMAFVERHTPGDGG